MAKIDKINLFFGNCRERITPLPKTAKMGITKRKRTIEAPVKLPTKTAGVLLMMELMPMFISGSELKKPRIKKETTNGERRSLVDK